MNGGSKTGARPRAYKTILLALLLTVTLNLAGQVQEDPFLDFSRKLSACASLRGLIPRDLAAAIGGNAEAVYGFVRDEISFQPYRGVLRGGTGTLLARAGNSFDQAVLLKEMLDSLGLRTRLARATLPAGLAELLNSTVVPGQPVSGSPLEPKDLAELGVDVTRFQREWKTHQDAEHAVIALAVEKGLADAAGMEPPASYAVRTPAWESTSDYLWVQLERDGRWFDLHPAFPKGTEVPVVPEGIISYTSSIPTELFHWVRLRLIAERVEGPELRKLIILENRILAGVAAGKTVSVALRPSPAEDGLVQLRPAVKVGESLISGRPLKVNAQEGKVANGGLTALWLEVTILSPGERPRHSTITVADIVPAGRRPSGKAELAEVPLPRTLTETELGMIIELMILTGSIDDRLPLLLSNELLAWMKQNADADWKALESRLLGFPAGDPLMLHWAALLDRCFAAVLPERVVFLDAPAVIGFLYRPQYSGNSYGLHSSGGLLFLRAAFHPQVDGMSAAAAGAAASRLLMELEGLRAACGGKKKEEIQPPYTAVADRQAAAQRFGEWSAESLEELDYDLSLSDLVLVPASGKSEFWWKFEKGTALPVARGRAGWVVHRTADNLFFSGSAVLPGALIQALSEAGGGVSPGLFPGAMKIWLEHYVLPLGASPALPVLISAGTDLLGWLKKTFEQAQ
jgi:hypothetical protein